MKPLIGVSADFKDGRCSVHPLYPAAIEAAGGIPLVMPQLASRQVLQEVLDRMDGFLITGGPDIPPTRYGQPLHPKTILITPERDAFDSDLIEALALMDKPVLGICYGAQAINVAFGGTLCQDIADLLPGSLRHDRIPGQDRPIHGVTVQPGSLLHRVLGVTRLVTNSSHHQAIDDVREPLKKVAFSEDNIIEAVESTKHRFLLGIQWHPEAMIEQELHLKLFQALIREAAR